MKLNELGTAPGEQKARKRIGRGIGSGTGKTSGRGHKGQKSRAGVNINGFEGGQMPIYRRLPRRGFHNKFRTEFEPVNFYRLQRAIDTKKLDASKPITPVELRAAGVVRGDREGIRLLARGELKAKVTIEVDGASKAAIAGVEKAGGTVTVSRPPKEKSADKPKEKKAKAKTAPEESEADAEKSDKVDNGKEEPANETSED